MLHRFKVFSEHRFLFYDLVAMMECDSAEWLVRYNED